MKKLILSLVVVLFATQVWASGSQLATINAITSGVVMPIVGTATITGQVNATITSMPAITGVVTANQGGNWTITSVTNPVAVTQSGGWAINATVTSMPALSETKDAVKIYGNYGGSQVQLKVDANGQIYAIASTVSGNNLEKNYIFSNITTGSYIEIGSYTVTSGKNAKLVMVGVTGGNVSYKVSDGTLLTDLYLETSAGAPSDSKTLIYPVERVAGTVIRVYANATDAVNTGTAHLNLFEY